MRNSRENTKLNQLVRPGSNLAITLKFNQYRLIIECFKALNSHFQGQNCLPKERL